MSTPWTYDHEDLDLAGDLVPADFVCSDQQPGIFRSWRGVLGFVGGMLCWAVIVGGWSFFFYSIWCGLARVLR